MSIVPVPARQCEIGFIGSRNPRCRQSADRFPLGLWLRWRLPWWRRLLGWWCLLGWRPQKQRRVRRVHPRVPVPFQHGQQNQLALLFSVMCSAESPNCGGHGFATRQWRHPDVGVQVDATTDFVRRFVRLTAASSVTHAASRRRRRLHASLPHVTRGQAIECSLEPAAIPEPRPRPDGRAEAGKRRNSLASQGVRDQGLGHVGRSAEAAGVA